MTKKNEKALGGKKKARAKAKPKQAEAKEKQPNEQPDYNYTWTLLNRMREKLLKHRIEARISWDEYQWYICTKLKIDLETGGLHKNDPRHWIWNDYAPSNFRLNQYAKYLKAEYPDFDFSAGYEQEYLQFALSLSSFSLSKKEIGDLEKNNFTKGLAGKILVSRAGEKIHDGQKDRDFDILNLRRIRDTPFMSFTMFRSTLLEGFHYAPVQARSITDPDFEAEFKYKVFKDGRPILVKVSSVRFGILCPTRTLGEFHGVMRDETYNARLILARFDQSIVTDKGSSPMDVWLDTREISFLEEDLLIANFNVVNLKSDGLKELFEKIGESPL